MTRTGTNESNGFQTDAAKYAAYLETPEGRLRIDLTFANLQEFLPGDRDSLRALDVGCGTGTIAVRLAQLGIHVTLVDSSPPMLELARRAAREAGVAEKITPKLGDAARLTDSFTTESFDIILCHNVLEYVEDPNAVLYGASRVVRNSSSMLSVVVRNRAGEVCKAAIGAGNLADAEDNLNSEWARESLYGGRVRLFTPDLLRAMLLETSMMPVASRGIRVLADYLPQRISRTADYERIYGFERHLGSRPEFAAIARYSHTIARRAGTMELGS